MAYIKKIKILYSYCNFFCQREGFCEPCLALSSLFITLYSTMFRIVIQLTILKTRYKSFACLQIEPSKFTVLQFINFTHVQAYIKNAQVKCLTSRNDRTVK